MGGSAPAHTTQTTEVKLPAWVDQASQSNYKLATQLANRKYVANPFEKGPNAGVATPSDMTTSGYDMLKAGAGSEAPWYGEAKGLYDKSAGPFDPSGYLNPYTDEVETRAIDNANRALTGQLSMADDAATKAGAFGGSAAGIQKGILGAEGARGIGDLSAGLRKEGYDTAVANMFTDRAGMRDAAAGITSTADARQRARMGDVSALLGAGSQEQRQRQAVLDAKKARWEQARNNPLEGLNLKLSALGMSPYGKTETMEKESTAEKQGMDFGTIFGGLMQFLPMMMGMSDRRAKTDIKRVGKAKSTGLPLYSYRYKGQRKDSPKVIGPMAQDIEKKFPGVVKEVGGYKVAPMGILTSG